MEITDPIHLFDGNICKETYLNPEKKLFCGFLEGHLGTCPMCGERSLFIGTLSKCSFHTAWLSCKNCSFRIFLEELVRSVNGNQKSTYTRLVSMQFLLNQNYLEKGKQTSLLLDLGLSCLNKDILRDSSFNALFGYTKHYNTLNNMKTDYNFFSGGFGSKEYKRDSTISLTNDCLTLPLCKYPGLLRGFWVYSNGNVCILRKRTRLNETLYLYLQWNPFGKVVQYSNMAEMFKKYPKDFVLGNLEGYTVIVKIDYLKEEGFTKSDISSLDS